MSPEDVCGHRKTEYENSRKTEAIIDLKIWFDRLLKQLFRSKQAVGPGIMSAILKNIRKKLSGI